MFDMLKKLIKKLFVTYPKLILVDLVDGILGKLPADGQKTIIVGAVVVLSQLIPQLHLTGIAADTIANLIAILKNQAGDVAMGNAADIADSINQIMAKIKEAGIDVMAITLYHKFTKTIG